MGNGPDRRDVHEMIRLSTVGDNLSRVGFCLALLALMGGLAIGAVPVARVAGLGVSPVIAANPFHLQARIQLMGGCVVLALAILWASSDRQESRRPELQALFGAAMITCLGSAALAALLNWAIVTGRVADHMGLIPAGLDMAAAALYAVVVAGLLSSARGPMGMEMLLYSGTAWLLVYAAGQLTWTAGRVFLDTGSLLWFCDVPAMEMVLLGFLVPTGFGLALGVMPPAAHDRRLLRSLPPTLQATNLCILLWFALRAWSLRYPGSYQQLVLALVGLVLLGCVMKIVLDSRLLDPWRRLGSGAPGVDIVRPHVPLALILLVIAGTLFAVTAVVVAGLSSAPPQVFVALVLALTVGFFTTLTSGLLGMLYARSPMPPSSHRMLVGTGWWIPGAAALSVVLWLMSTVVERSLRPFTLAVEVAIGLGLVALFAWVWRLGPTEPGAD